MNSPFVKALGDDGCRRNGRLALLLAAVIIVPPIVVDLILTLTGSTVLGVGPLYGILIDYRDRVPGAPSLGKYRATFLLMLIGLLAASTICVAFGVAMLKSSSSDRCRLLLRHLMLLPIWALLIGIVLAVVGIHQVLGYYFGSLIVLYFMEWLFIVPHLLAVLFLWGTGMALSFRRLI